MRLLAIDPGNRESAYCILDTDTWRPSEFAKVDNADMLGDLGVLNTATYDRAVIEQIGHYGTGMPAGRDVFDTCRTIGRFEQILDQLDIKTNLVLRVKVKAHLCRSARATDANVSQALRDRFAPGVRNYGKGVKADPGFFYGFHRDCWQAYALAVYVADHLNPRPGWADEPAPF